MTPIIPIASGVGVMGVMGIMGVMGGHSDSDTPTLTQRGSAGP